MGESVCCFDKEDHFFTTILDKIGNKNGQIKGIELNRWIRPQFIISNIDTQDPRVINKPQHRINHIGRRQHRNFCLSIKMINFRQGVIFDLVIGGIGDGIDKGYVQCCVELFLDEMRDICGVDDGDVVLGAQGEELLDWGAGYFCYCWVAFLEG